MNDPVFFRLDIRIILKTFKCGEHFPLEAFVLVENGGQPPSIYLAELLLQIFLLSVSD